MLEFGTLQSAMFTLIKLLIGEQTDVLQEMLSIEPKIGRLYFVALFSVHVLFIFTIFIGIVINSFNKEMKFLQKEGEHGETIEVVYRIFSSYYKMKKKKIRDKRNKKGGKVDDQIRLTCCMGLWKTPRWVIKIMDMWLDPHTQDVQKLPDNLEMLPSIKRINIKDKLNIDSNHYAKPLQPVIPVDELQVIKEEDDSIGETISEHQDYKVPQVM